MKILLKLIRPKHWIKNLFVVIPIVFAKKIFDPVFLSNSLITFAAFCLLSSGVYIMNDIKDAPFDRLHPAKKNRPIASGLFDEKKAKLLVFILIILSLSIGFLQNLYVLICLCCYFLLNTFYTFKGKSIPLLDVLLISTGFALRVIAGSYSIDSKPSGWLVTSAFFLALFLGFGKRRGEITKYNNHGHRFVLKYYDENLLGNVMISTGTAAMVLYSLYTLDSKTVEQFSTDKLYYTIPFVVYGIFRYIFLLLKNGEAEPTEVILKDKGMILSIFLWFVSVVIVLYFGGS